MITPDSKLNVVDTRPPRRAETSFPQLTAHSRALGYSPIAIIRGPGWVQQELERLAIETHIIYCKGSFNLTFLRALLNIIRKEQDQLFKSHLMVSAVYAGFSGLISITTVYANLQD